eukprot:3344577-Pyramimonas_sp.AAC.1
MLTETDSESSGAFVCYIQRSELGLLLELGPRDYSYSSSHLERCCRFSLLNSGCRGATGLVITKIDSERSGASACRMQRSEIGLLLELGPQNYSYCSSHLDRNCRFSVRNSSSTAATELMRTETDLE